MLQNGAAKVYAVDVGYGQLAWKLRTDERVYFHMGFALTHYPIFPGTGLCEQPEG